MKLKFFTKDEFRIVGVVLLFIGIISFFNYQISLARGRDLDRKNDLSYISKLLDKYKDENMSYPASQDGKIVACPTDDPLVLRPCEWGKDGLGEAKTLPQDPRKSDGASYYYVSNRRNFQIYAALEREDQDEYESNIFVRKLPCGTKICNLGRSSDIPLDKSIEEYENELNAKTSQ